MGAGGSKNRPASRGVRILVGRHVQHIGIYKTHTEVLGSGWGEGRDEDESGLGRPPAEGGA